MKSSYLSNRKRISLLIVLLVVAGGISYLIISLLNTDEHKSADAEIQLSEQSTASTEVRDSGEINLSELSYFEKQAKLNEILNTPIDFYGLVLDENDRPVRNAQTSYILRNKNILLYAGSPTLQGPQTSNDGRFSITDLRGLKITVYIEHPDYYVVDKGGKSLSYARLNGSKPKDLPSIENPVIFRLQRKGEIEPLVYHPRILTRIPVDGTPTRIDLIAGRQGISSTSLILILNSNSQAVPKNTYVPYDWSLEVKVADGKIAKRTGKLQFMTPEAGYTDELNYVMTANSSDWKGDIVEDVFLEFSSGLYARASIRVGGRGNCIIESWVNPSGSRNLEYDPDKQIDP